MSIVREHGGNIEAQALPAGGSAFVVYLPVASGGPVSAPPDARLAQPAIANLARGDSPDQHSLKNLSVLVLDDEESIRMLLEEGLSAHGLRVNTAHTLAQAVALASKDSYDVLLCDLNLSENGSRVSGQDAAAQVLSAAAHSAKPLVVFMTGDFIEASEAESRTSRYRVLQKPFRISDVLALLREIVPFDAQGPAS